MFDDRQCARFEVGESAGDAHSPALVSEAVVEDDIVHRYERQRPRIRRRAAKEGQILRRIHEYPHPGHLHLAVEFPARDADESNIGVGKFFRAQPFGVRYDSFNDAAWNLHPNAQARLRPRVIQRGREHVPADLYVLAVQFGADQLRKIRRLRRWQPAVSQETNFAGNHDGPKTGSCNSSDLDAVSGKKFNVGSEPHIHSRAILDHKEVFGVRAKKGHCSYYLDGQAFYRLSVAQFLDRSHLGDRGLALANCERRKRQHGQKKDQSRELLHLCASASVRGCA
jgi:hypothetical protein